MPSPKEGWEKHSTVGFLVTKTFLGQYRWFLRAGNLSMEAQLHWLSMALTASLFCQYGCLSAFVNNKIDFYFVSEGRSAILNARCSCILGWEEIRKIILVMIC